MTREELFQIARSHLKNSRLLQVNSICEDILSLDECPSVASIQESNKLLIAENDKLRLEVESLRKSRGGRPKSELTDDQRRELKREYMRQYRQDRRMELAELRAKVYGDSERR